MKNNQGFSLIEFVIVIIILSFGLTTLILAIRYSAVFNAKVQVGMMLDLLSQEKMEEVLNDRRQNGFNALSIGQETESPVPAFSQYARTKDISYVDLSDLKTPVIGPTDYKRIEVTVSGPGDTAPVTVEAVATDY